mmetsp:Transcript_8141/g.20934  ORF Transcript_8141/g.20934 Transcript_8141/m.20934 type:complete len:202 (+) Transcript_8141:147-752(+)
MATFAADVSLGPIPTQPSRSSSSSPGASTPSYGSVASQGWRRHCSAVGLASGSSVSAEPTNERKSSSSTCSRWRSDVIFGCRHVVRCPLPPGALTRSYSMQSGVKCLCECRPRASIDGGKGPRTPTMRQSIEVTESFWNSTYPVHSSARMQPSDQMSIRWSYGQPRITSGARYERDCTYELRWSVVKQLEPKSMTFTSQRE